MSLEGRVALVAAASQGLGKASAAALARDGATVAICARSRAKLADVAAEIRSATGQKVLPLVCDLGDPAAIAAAVAEVTAAFGGVDILVNNAGGPPPKRFLETTDADYLGAFEENFLSAVRLTRAVVPGMQAKQWGRIINITSIGVKQPLENLVISNAIRMAIVGLAKSLANELGPDNILVNNVCPGSVYTERIASLVEARAKRAGIPLAQAQAERVMEIPLRRFGKPEELAELVAFLASERAGFITGTTIQVDGGIVRSAL